MCLCELQVVQKLCRAGFAVIRLFSNAAVEFVMFILVHVVSWYNVDV